MKKCVPSKGTWRLLLTPDKALEENNLGGTDNLPYLVKSIFHFKWFGLVLPIILKE